MNTHPPYLDSNFSSRNSRAGTLDIEMVYKCVWTPGVSRFGGFEPPKLFKILLKCKKSSRQGGGSLGCGGRGWVGDGDRVM